MQSTLALHVPQRGPTRSPAYIAGIDILAGLLAFDIWGRLGWRETKRRYRRTVLGPVWATVSVALVVLTLGLLWSNLWGRDPKVYLPYLTSGMLCWTLISSICTDGAYSYFVNEKLIKQLRISYTLIACAQVWRNVIVFLHNLIIYLGVCVYAGVPVTWATLMVVPGFLLLCLNGAWIAVVLGTVCARYRDLLQFVTSMLQILVFLTPIFWSPDQLSGRAVLLAEYNPLYHLIAVVRDPMLGRSPEPVHWIAVIVITLAGWALTLRLMSKVRHRIVYWL